MAPVTLPSKRKHMIARSIALVEKDSVNIPIQPVVVPAATSTTVLPSIRNLRAEYMTRLIFNAGSDNMYVNFDATASLTSYCFWIVPGQMCDVSFCGCAVNIFSTAGGTVPVTLIVRNDCATHQTFAN